MWNPWSNSGAQDACITFRGSISQTRETPWPNSGLQDASFRGTASQTREVEVSPRKYKSKETWKHTFDSPRKPVAKRAVQRLEFSPRSTLKIDVYFENINGDICLTKIRPENKVRWKLLKEKYWPLEFHSAITNKKTVENGIYNMKNHKTLHVTLTDKDAQPYINGKYIDMPKKPKTVPKPKAKKKSTPSKKVNIRNETTNNYYFNSGPSTSNRDMVEYETDRADEFSDSECSDSEYSDSDQGFHSYVHNESRYTKNVYWD